MQEGGPCKFALLPEACPLKAKLGWIYGQRFVASQTLAVRLEHEPENGLVRFHGLVTREIRNVSGEKTRFRVSGGTDEWFHPNAESTLTNCTLTQDARVTRIPTRKNLVGLEYDLGDPIDLAPARSCTISLTYSLVRNGNVDVQVPNRKAASAVGRSSEPKGTRSVF